MIGRCTSPKHARYSSYGGRGIRVCDRWTESLSNFIADMGRRPSPAHSLDRKDNDGPYSPDNCRWATAVEQGRNKRNNVLLVHRGKSQPLIAWAEETGLPDTSIRRRLCIGWSVAEALDTPIGQSDGARRRAACEKPSAAQLLALSLLSAGALRRVELAKSSGCDVTKLAARGYIEKPKRFGAFRLTPKGMAVLQRFADGKVEVAA
jgi:hypothetical protein